jgi:hypothetical protein
VCLGNPEGRVSFGSLVTRGFRLFRGYFRTQRPYEALRCRLHGVFSTGDASLNGLYLTLSESPVVAYVA